MKNTLKTRTWRTIVQFVPLPPRQNLLQRALEKESVSSNCRLGHERLRARQRAEARAAKRLKRSSALKPTAAKPNVTKKKKQKMWRWGEREWKELSRKAWAELEKGNRVVIWYSAFETNRRRH